MFKMLNGKNSFYQLNLLDLNSLIYVTKFSKMNTIIKKSFVLLFALCPVTFILCQTESEETGMPGDHFSLHGALEMFKKAGSVEEFEKYINEQDNGVNNLDLNEDGNVDYISVYDNQDKEAHAIVMQIAISEDEMQDIAVIEVEKTGKDYAILQIIGDEEIFGEEIIVEASDGNEEEFEYLPPAKGGLSDNTDFRSSIIVVNVWTWPTVRFIYSPVYKPYRSPWHWKHYPTWYRPWRPLTWHVFHPFALRHRHAGFRTVTTHRVVTAHRVYSVHRKSSVTVSKRYAGNKSNYKITRTTRKVSVTGPRGNQSSVKQTKTKVRRKKN